MDEPPELGGRDERDQPVTNDHDVSDTDGWDANDAWDDDDTSDDTGDDTGDDTSDDTSDNAADDAAVPDGVVNGVEYAGADDDGPRYEDGEDQDAAYEDADYPEGDYAEGDYQGAQDGEYDDSEYDERDYQDAFYEDGDYDGDYEDGEHEVGYAEADDPEADDEPSSGAAAVAPVATAGLLEPRAPDDEPAPRRDRRRVGPLAAFLLGALAGLLLLGTAWVTVSLTSSNESVASRRPGGSAAQAARAAQVSQDRAAHERLMRCRAADAAQSRALAAAGSTLQQWEVHVDAMNQLVVGTITLHQATEFWNRTRQGAVQRLIRYLSTAAEARKLQAKCPPSSSAHAPRALRTCIHAVDVRRRTLQMADTAITTWRRHVRDMDMLRSGRLSPSMANQMWLANWHKGVDQLHAYRRALHRAPDGACA